MNILPNWNSIESSARWSDILFWVGIICLILLAVAEIGSHIYGSRSSFLVEEAARLAGIQRTRDEDAAKKQRDEEAVQLRERLAAAQRAAAEATEKAARVEASQADRRLSDEQKRVILAAISPYPGQKVDLVAVMGDGEAFKYAQDFLGIFNAANWDIGGINQAVYNGQVLGVTVSISKTHGERNTAPVGAGHLMMALIELGIIKEGFSDAAVIEDNVQVRIGRKPPAS
jgi:hypothetical protein